MLSIPWKDVTGGFKKEKRRKGKGVKGLQK